MVGSWLPDPSKHMDPCPFSLQTNIHLDGGESDGEEPIEAYFGYELLPHDTNGDGEQMSDGESSDELEESNEQSSQVVTTAEVQQPNRLNVSPDNGRPDIEVNHEEVREIMSNITLPPSSFPTWATNIPESQWTAFLISRLKNEENDNVNDK